jgi:choline dehydrogenase-like flavoprotein
MGLAMTDKAMREKGLLNGSISFDPVKREHPSQAKLSSLLSPRNIARSGPELLAELGYDLKSLDARLHERPPPTDVVNLTVDIEQQPTPDSRLTLSDKRDALGLPQSRVDWRITGKERETARFLVASAASEFARMGWGRTKLEPWVQDASIPLDGVVNTTFHFSGTTRMSSDPKAGVVDADCKVHGVSNLYVAGSSVFPTVGHINPTFTIVALATRLADRIAANPRRA